MVVWTHVIKQSCIKTSLSLSPSVRARLSRSVGARVRECVFTPFHGSFPQFTQSILIRYLIICYWHQLNTCFIYLRKLSSTKRRPCYVWYKSVWRWNMLGITRGCLSYFHHIVIYVALICIGRRFSWNIRIILSVHMMIEVIHFLINFNSHLFLLSHCFRRRQLPRNHLHL